MMTQTDCEYFRTRLEQERARAARATEPGVRRVHDELAKRYAAIVASPPVAR